MSCRFSIHFLIYSNFSNWYRNFLIHCKWYLVYNISHVVNIVRFIFSSILLFQVFFFVALYIAKFILKHVSEYNNIFFLIASLYFNLKFSNNHFIQHLTSLCYTNNYLRAFIVISSQHLCVNWSIQRFVWLVVANPISSSSSSSSFSISSLSSGQN